MNYTKELLDEIWEKATYINVENEKRGFRKDSCGAWIKRDQHGEEGKYGWEVDHIYPESKAIDDDIPEEKYNDIVNLQPLHHKNNGSEGKGDDYPTYYSKLVSEETNNIEKVIQITIPETKQKELEKYFAK